MKATLIDLPFSETRVAQIIYVFICLFCLVAILVIFNFSNEKEKKCPPFIFLGLFRISD